MTNYNNTDYIKSISSKLDYDEFVASLPPMKAKPDDNFPSMVITPQFKLWQEHFVNNFPLPYYFEGIGEEKYTTHTRYFLRKAFLGFIEAADKYIANPKDFVAAYEFLNQHPMFWKQHPTHQESWAHSSGVRSLELILMEHKGKPVFAFEAGPFRTDFPNGCHDLKLDVWGKTWEDGIIKMAHKVHKFYDLEGKDRENVVYQKSQLELDLDKAVNEAKNEGLL